MVMTSRDVLFLLRVDLLGGGIGEMRQRDPADIDMRLRQLGGLRHHDMGMDVDRGGGGAPGEAVGVVDAGGGAAIAVLAIDHLRLTLLLSGCLRGVQKFRRIYALALRWAQRVETAVASASPRPAASASS